MSYSSFLNLGAQVAVSSDHAGYELKSVLIKDLEDIGFEALDLGTYNESSVDYPDFAIKLANEIGSGKVQGGVIVCGTGIGVSITANREPSVRAALVHNELTAMMARAHNNANVMAIGARVVNQETARRCLKTFFSTSFEGGRHIKRVEKLTSYSGRSK